jgi:hypothetical protein
MAPVLSLTVDLVEVVAVGAAMQGAAFTTDEHPPVKPGISIRNGVGADRRFRKTK